MKHEHIKAGHSYRTKMNGRASVVLVENVRTNNAGTVNLYDVVDTKTGRKSTITNHVLFLEEVKTINPGDLVTVRDAAQIFKVEWVKGEVVKMVNGPTVTRPFVRIVPKKVEPPKVIQAVVPSKLEKAFPELVAKAKVEAVANKVVTPTTPKPKAEPIDPLDAIAEKVYQALGVGQRSLAELAADIGESQADTSGALLKLELAKRARRMPGNYYVRYEPTSKIEVTASVTPVVRIGTPHIPIKVPVTVSYPTSTWSPNPVVIPDTLELFILDALKHGKRTVADVCREVGRDEESLASRFKKLSSEGKIEVWVDKTGTFLTLRKGVAQPSPVCTPEQLKAIMPDPEGRPRHWTEDWKAEGIVKQNLQDGETVDQLIERLNAEGENSPHPQIIPHGNHGAQLTKNTTPLPAGQRSARKSEKASATAPYANLSEGEDGPNYEAALQKGVTSNTTPVLSSSSGNSVLAAVNSELKATKAPVSLSGVGSNLMVVARAGTGKTTTLVQGIRGVMGMDPREMIGTDGSVKTIEPMAQQEAIWKEMKAGKKPKYIAFVAFNKSIAGELKKRVPKDCDASTMHGMGFKSIMKKFKLREGEEVNEYRVSDIIGEMLGKEPQDLRKEKPTLMSATQQLVSLVKANLTDLRGNSEDALDRLASYYDIELRDDNKDWSGEVFDLVPKIIERCKDINRDGCIDFDDMMWLPVAMNIPVFQYDLLLGDEVQDWNRCQQAFAKKAGKRLILCGDPKQAIYGWMGADSDSMPRMTNELRVTPLGVKELPLTVTRRCGKAIVEEAKRIVPDFSAHETNCEGKISRARYELKEDEQYLSKSKPHTYHKDVKDGDMVLCRVNAPLVSQCFRFIKEGRKANIQGRNVGQGLITTITKMGVETVVELVGKMDKWYDSEVRKESARRNPSEQKLIALQDKYQCLVCFTEGVDTVPEVIEKIKGIFKDEVLPGIRLSSIHKAKGLEAQRVFFLRPKGAECPHPMARSPWQVEQEKNLVYVATTRAIEELIHVI